MSLTVNSSSHERLEEKTGDYSRLSRRITNAKDVDIAAHLLISGSADLDPVEAAKVRRKIDRNLIPLMCMITSLQFMDKVSLGTASIMGIREATHLTINEYNWLGTIFYLGYLAFEFPQNLCLQRFPVGKWMSFNIIVWATALCCHAACRRFSGLLVVRLILGACEGCITAGFVLVSSMFYTQQERIVRVGFWYSSSGIASIVSSFLSYGVLHIKHSRLEPWQWFMIIIGMITFVTGVIFWFAFPDSPTTAWFLTPEERIVAVKRIQVEQTGIENKHFKMYQFTEALHDPKIWLFTLFSAVHTLHSSITNQRWIIVSSFGFTDFQNVLLGCVDGVLTTSGLMLGAFLASQFYNGRAYVAAACYVPGILAAVLLNVLSEDNKLGLLFSFWLTALPLSPYMIMLTWSASVTTGHTKKTVLNAFIFSGYCIGYAAGQFIWQKQYQPRNRVPWIIVGCTYLTAGCLLLVIRALLARENARREARGAAEVDEQYDHVYMERLNHDGTIKVDKTLLDLTDIQNQDFRYVL